MDFDVYAAPNKSPVVFVAVPRTERGVPITLGSVLEASTPKGNRFIRSFPSWEWQQPASGCTGFTSVNAIQIDSCGRMWVLDSGRIYGRQASSPKLLAFDLKDKNTLLSCHVFSHDQHSRKSLFAALAVDVRHNKHGQCSDTYVYIVDAGENALFVYDDGSKTSWKIANNLFNPSPQYRTIIMDNQSVDLVDGIVGLALGPIGADGDRNLYFHSLISRVESWVPTSVIRNRDTFSSNSGASPRFFQEFKGERSSQSAAQVMDESGVMFFSLLSDTAIACWNSTSFPEYEMKNIEKIAVDRDTLRFPTGMKIVTPSNGSPELWILTNKLQNERGYAYTSDRNIRIQKGIVEELIRDTKCSQVV